MFLSLCYMGFWWALQLATLRLRSNDCKELEIVVLRHELAILRRGTHRPAMAWTDRCFLAAASRLPQPCPSQTERTFATSVGAMIRPFCTI